MNTDDLKMYFSDFHMFLEYHQTKKSLFITTFSFKSAFTSKLSIAGFIKAILTMIKKIHCAVQHHYTAQNCSFTAFHFCKVWLID